ncbi:hypothetical protein KPH14_010105 [Odynerus spinipes]|uniref:Uncharacterized protein n=1 Tax=Odynerus spinipes TaxID=1348599 RepID=A0AAD9RT38_9HYME|nr:hypothetical protein KPH14_010105 [Odynerus spinipes]
MATIKSGADTRRTELEQCCRKLKVAETKCGSLKSKINYMKMFCQIKTDATETQPSTNTLEATISNLQEHEEPENSRIKRNVNLGDSNINTSNSQNYYSYIRENQSSEETLKGDLEIEKSNEQVSKLDKTEGPHTTLDSVSVCSTLKAIPHETKQVCQKEDILKNIISATKKQEVEYTTQMQDDILNFKGSTEQLTVNNSAEWNSQIPSLANPNINSQELRLNISSSIKNARLSKCRSLMKGNKDLTITTINVDKKKSACKTDQIVNSKIRKRRGKLRNISSKSTVATKEMSITARRDMRKRKQKDHRLTQSEQITTSSKLQQNWSGIVELYHNAAMKSDSISAVSSKLESQVKKINKRSNVHNDQHNMHLKLQHTYDQCQQNQHDVDHKLSTSGEVAMIEDKDPYRQTLNTDKISVSDHECKLYQQQNTMFDVTCYVPLANRNYEMPTLASKLKRTNRSYFNRFNFRNIPFVVGTSVTPSHNLGLNIQQVLSIIKTRQPPVTGITPLLMRKVSRGLEPVSTLMKQMVVQSQDISMEKDSCVISTLENQCSYPEEESAKFVKQLSTIESEKNPEVILQNETDGFTNFNNIQKQQKISTEKEPITNYCFPTKDTTHLKTMTEFTPQWNLRNYPETTNCFPQEEQSTINCAKSKSNTELSTSKGIREVLLNLHDQFEAMNVKYEKLQKKAENSNDQSLMNEITIVEKELNAKEEEINALISLYKEVMALKQQMKILQQKNSLVCIATKIPAMDRMYASTPGTLSKTCKTYTGNAMHAFNMKRRNMTSTPREASTSMKLAGLLRQIQMFQKQLKLAS